MLTIKQVFDSLNPEDKARLDYCFENRLEQFVELPNGRYIGVNIARIMHLRPEVSRGVWSIGEILRDKSPAT